MRRYPSWHQPSAYRLALLIEGVSGSFSDAAHGQMDSPLPRVSRWLTCSAASQKGSLSTPCSPPAAWLIDALDTWQRKFQCRSVQGGLGMRVNNVLVDSSPR